MIRPPNSIVFVSDIDLGEIPAGQPVQPVAASSSCLIVACYTFCDGPKLIAFGSSPEVDPGWPPAFAGEIETPKAHIMVSTVDGQILFKQRTNGDRAFVSVWVTHDKWPDKVFIGVD
jgi:hypothetical protein